MSSGGGGSQTSTTTSQLPPWLTGAAQQYLGAAGQVAQLPYEAYQGQRVADLSPTQQSSIQGISDLSGGLPSMWSAEGMLNNTLQGGNQNPYGGMDSPYFQRNLNSGLNDITDAYGRGTSADTTRMFNLAGAFGGSAHQQAIANNERELGRTLANYEGSQRQGQYDRSAQLAESGLNRQMQAVPLSSGLYSAGMQGLSTALNAGDIERRQQQSLLDSQYGDFMDWRNYPEHQLGVFGNAMGAVTGAAPRTQTTEIPNQPPDRVAQGMGIMSLANAYGRGSGK